MEEPIKALHDRYLLLQQRNQVELRYELRISQGTSVESAVCCVLFLKCCLPQCRDRRRVNLEREADFRRMLLQYAKCQASLVQQSADLWADLVQSLE
eukprot:scaffold192046_cov17-Tisochrysis_lutea.AAC.1